MIGAAFSATNAAYEGYANHAAGVATFCDGFQQAPALTGPTATHSSKCAVCGDGKAQSYAATAGAVCQSLRQATAICRHGSSSSASHGSQAGLGSGMGHRRDGAQPGCGQGRAVNVRSYLAGCWMQGLDTYPWEGACLVGTTDVDHRNGSGPRWPRRPRSTICWQRSRPSSRHWTCREVI